MIVELEPLPGVNQYDVGEVFDELYDWIEKNVRAMATGKLCHQVTYDYLGEAKDDGLAEGYRCIFEFDTPGGLCEMSAIACDHWFELSVAMMDLDTLIEPMGYKIASPTATVAELLARGEEYPLVEIDDMMYAASFHSGSYYLIDDGLPDPIGYEDLPKFSQQTIREIVDGRQCRCKPCRLLRAGEFEPIKTKPFVAPAPETSSFRRLSAALRNPDVADELRIDEQQLEELSPEIGKLVNLRVLIARMNYIDVIPPEIGHLKKLRQLDLSNNSIEVIPPEIAHLENLETLGIEANDLTELPDEIGELHSLKSLDIERNKIRELPSSFSKLVSLEKLDLFRLPIPKLPPVLLELPKLKELDIRYMPITAEDLLSFPFDRIQNLEQLEYYDHFNGFPMSLLKATQMRRVDMSKYFKGCIPPEIANWQQIEQLVLLENELTELPSELFALKSLKSLSVSDNCLTNISDEIGNLTNLELLFVGGNPLECLPETIGNLTNLRCINFYGGGIKRLPNCLGDMPNLETLLFDCENAKDLVAPLDLSHLEVEIKEK